MGKGTILSGGPTGLYTVKVILNRARIAKMIAKLNENIKQFKDQLDKIEIKITGLTNQISALQASIILYQVDIKKYQKEIETALASQTPIIEQLYALRLQKGVLNFKSASMQLQINYLNQNMPADPELSAWCADLTEDLTGEVATIEVPGERGTVLICPGDYSDYDAANDGQLNPAINQTPEQCFYNLAMLPGWQKWMPTYRFATITKVDTVADTCDVLFDAAVSSQQGLNIVNETALGGVPVEYMT